MISDQERAAIRERADIVSIVGAYVALKPDGRGEFIGLCPFHKEKSPSFSVGPRGYKCFGCDAKGDVFRFVQEIEHVGFHDAIQRVKELSGGDSLPQKQSEAPTVVHPPRGPVVATYKYYDERGKLVYYINRHEPGRDGRKKDFSPYVPGASIPKLPEGIRRVLYNLPAVVKSPEVWIVEGEKDANTLISIGLVATSPPFGSNRPWEPHFTAAVAGKRVIIIPDNDEAGRKKAALIHAAVAGSRILELPDIFSDATDYIEAGHTAQNLRDILDPPKPVVQMSTARLPAHPFLLPPEIKWQEVLIYSNNGAIKPCLGNAMMAARHSPEWAGVLAFDAFQQRSFAVKSTPWGFSGGWTGRQDTYFTEWLHKEGITVPSSVATEVIEAVSQENTFHPVRDYLNGLVWDRKPRLHHWLETYAGADPSSYAGRVGEIGAMWMIQCVARIYRPGVKADSCLILEGKQNKGKSTTLDILGGEWFSDNIPELGTKDSRQYLPGKWIIEIAELDRMTRGEVTAIKGFITCRVDRYRPSYGRRTEDFPRQCVFAGSTNRTDWGRDETGARRFWPVYCSQIDLDALRRDRDQLWAEARLRFEANENWWIEDAETLAAAEQEQANRYEGDAWDDIVKVWLIGKDDCSVTEILAEAIKKPIENWNTGDKMRVGKVLTSMRWEKYRSTIGLREWRYRLTQ